MTLVCLFGFSVPVVVEITSVTLSGEVQVIFKADSPNDKCRVKFQHLTYLDRPISRIITKHPSQEHNNVTRLRLDPTIYRSRVAIITTLQTTRPPADELMNKISLNELFSNYVLWQILRCATECFVK